MIVIPLNSQVEIRVIEKFTHQLNSENTSNIELIETYFLPTQNLDSTDREVFMAVVSEQLNLLRTKFSGCMQIEVVKHNEDLQAIKSFNLQHKDTANVYYIFCNRIILTPVLVKGDKLASITVVSKTETGKKVFMTF